MKIPSGNPKFQLNDRVCYLDNGQDFKIGEVVAYAFNEDESWLYCLSVGWLKRENELIPLSSEQAELIDRGRPEFLSLQEIYDSSLPSEMMAMALTK